MSSNTISYNSVKKPHNLPMSSELWQRIKVARNYAKLTQSELGEFCTPKVSRAAVAQWESKDPKTRTTPKFDNLQTIHEKTGCPLAWLVSDESDIDAEWMNLALTDDTEEFRSNVIAVHHEDKLPPEFIKIPEYKISFSAGNGHTMSYEIVEEGTPVTYRLDWFRAQRMSPDRAIRFKVVGDSMEPLLYDGDSVLVDMSENSISSVIDGKVYAIRYMNDLRIKRLYKKLDGTLTLRSDNPHYKDEDVPPALVDEHISIIGRVRDRSGAGSL